MKKFLILSAVLAFGLIAGCKQQDVTGKAVEYTADGVTLKGYLAYNKNTKVKSPAVLVVHEWWGHNEYTKKRAMMLAELGYTALALDMYGDGKQALHPDDAKKFAGEVMKNMDSAKARFNAALEFLKKQPNVDPEKIAAIGYCFGGGVVLNMARSGINLKGIASFHGSIATKKPAKAGDIKAKILVLNGDDDKMTTKEQIEAFKKEMKDAKVDYQFISYPGAKHAFTNPEADNYAKKFNLPLGYNADADKKSWEELKVFLKKIFG